MFLFFLHHHRTGYAVPNNLASDSFAPIIDWSNDGSPRLALLPQGKHPPLDHLSLMWEVTILAISALMLSMEAPSPPEAGLGNTRLVKNMM